MARLGLIEDKMSGDLKFGAIHGNSEERAIVEMHIREAIAEIKSLRRQVGEYICERCHLRQDVPRSDEETPF